jgi:biopolymer transport protein ExbD
MAINLGPASGEDDVISQINTTPLVDVMLVLLIIFLITIPVVTTSIPLSLPKERIEARQSKPDSIIVSVNRNGGLYWYDTPMTNVEALIKKLKIVSLQVPQPEVQIRGDMVADFEGVGRIMYACQRAGITKVAFITEPTARGS